MPKIVIREYDKTSAGVGLYSNFTVLVPGFVGNSYDATKFDENGVYEVSSKNDFDNYIGKKAADEGIIRDAWAPTINGEIFQYPDGSEESGYEWIIGKFAELAEGEGLFEVTENESGEIGYHRDEEHEFTQLIESEIESDYDAVGKSYAKITLGENEGGNTEYGEQYGNQIAYELIKLGYTVLFKKVDHLSDLSSDAFWSPLKDKSVYDFRFVINGLITGNDTANIKIRDLADFVNTNPKGSGRGDCVALCDVDSTTYIADGQAISQATAIENIKIKVQSFTASKYAALFAPFVTYNMLVDEAYAGNTTFPAHFHYLACAAKAAENYNEWYAIAGYSRGISPYNIAAIGCKFGEAAVDALEPRYQATNDNLDKAVNLIIKVKNNFYLWGNRTAEELGKEGSDNADLRASHFLNIRQLCTTIKKQVYITCRKYTFDPNSDTLWINFCNDIRPLLEKMKADQGITDYKFVKIKTSQKGILKAKIRIVPIEAVEDFDISLTLEDSITGTESVIDE